MFSLSSTTKHWQEKSGFTLIEIVVAIGIFAIFSVGIYSGLQFVFRLVYNSRINIIETAILNEQIESIRNMAYEDIGIINGSPSGLLTRTASVTRNEIVFSVTRTIRYIDDPFDGTINNPSDPDMSPADYKMLDVSVRCTSCSQQHSVSMNTYITPPYLEGASNHGALFVTVLDAAGNPVQGATVSVFSDTTNPTYDFSDTTDNNGQLAIVDLAEGTNAYHLTITKDGFTMDETYPTSTQNPTPISQDASIIAQNVTEKTFYIDEPSVLTVKSYTSDCQPVDADINLMGSKLIGQSPDVLLVNEEVSTVNGSHIFSNLVWDVYQVAAAGYDIAGAIPNDTVTLFPGQSEEMKVILESPSTNALRVNVVDSVTGLPLSNATITISASGFTTQEKISGVGTITQPSWDGGPGQETMIFDDMFASGVHMNYTQLPGWIKLDTCTVTASNDCGWNPAPPIGTDILYSFGELESSTFDFGEDATYEQILMEPHFYQNAGDIRIQIATATSSNPGTWNFLGPDGTSGTYYSLTDSDISSVHDGQQYLRYKIQMIPNLGSGSLIADSISIIYTNGCIPPGQVYFGSIPNKTYTVTVSATGYTTNVQSVPVSGYTTMSVNMTAS